MRLHLTNPNSTEAMTEGAARAARAAAPAGVEILATTAAGAPVSIEGAVDGALAVPHMLARIAEAEALGVDAHVIACFDDTGLDAARALATGPVIGIGEAAAHCATLIAERFAVVTSVHAAIPVLRGNLTRYGLISRCAGLRAAGAPVLDIDEGKPEAVAAIKREARAALDQDGAEAIVLGCAGMAWLARELEAELDCPVVEGVATAVNLACALTGAGLRTSKRGGYAPPSKPFPGGSA